MAGLATAAYEEEAVGFASQLPRCRLQLRPVPCNDGNIDSFSQPTVSRRHNRAEALQMLMLAGLIEPRAGTPPTWMFDPE